MTRLTLPLLCECLLLCIPLNIYVIGNNLAEGIQWALFRYQQSPLGTSLILLPRDLLFVTGGILKGSSVYSTLIWVCGAVLLSVAILLLALAAFRNQPGRVFLAGVLTVIGGLLFLLSMAVQYGPALANSHGSSVPIGIPVIVVTGIWLMYEKFDSGDNTTEDNENPGTRGT